MDLGAYVIMEEPEIKAYLEKHYGDVPRPRGVRFMALHKETDCDEDDVVFKKYCGQDIIYIHTRCGECGMGFDYKPKDPEQDLRSNYEYFGADKWEEAHKDLFLEHEADDDDKTYASHYFKAVVDDEYRAIIDNLKKLFYNE